MNENKSRNKVTKVQIPSNSSSFVYSRQGVRFMHLSDLHVGMANQGWLWPAFQKAFIDDIKNLYRKFGAWDIVIFSGDLTQKASKEEYQALTKILQEIWAVFKELGFEPILFPVPGNHDLVRPDVLNAASRILDNWWQETEIQKIFWEEKGHEYLNLISSAFRNYTDWLSSVNSQGIPIPTMQPGIVAGDNSAVVTVNGHRIGLIGLNSAWLQLTGGEYKARLHVDTRQLLAVTNSNPDRWCSANNFNLLVSHHPTDWLNSMSQSHWRSEIFTHDRFDMHLHGHMHEPSATTIAEGGFASRRIKQGASLFGLEAAGSNEIKRIHGYSVFQLHGEKSNRSIRHWPRKKHTVADGTHKLVPDHDFNIGDEGYFEETYSLNSNDSSQIPKITTISPHDRLKNSVEVLSPLRLTLSSSSAHTEVRRVEQNISVTELKKSRFLWLVADWGLGSEQFVCSIKDKLSISNEQIYQLDCQHYYTRSEILAGVQDQVGFSFEHLCGLIASQPSCIFLLEDVPIAEGKDRETKKLQFAIEQLRKL
jgi:predicted MPP superfamily phosphohydrolase